MEYITKPMMNTSQYIDSITSHMSTIDYINNTLIPSEYTHKLLYKLSQLIPEFSTNNMIIHHSFLFGVLTFRVVDLFNQNKTLYLQIDNEKIKVIYEYGTRVNNTRLVTVITPKMIIDKKYSSFNTIINAYNSGDYYINVN